MYIFFYPRHTITFPNKEKTFFFSTVLPYAIASINPKLIRFKSTNTHYINNNNNNSKKAWPYQCKTKCIYFARHFFKCNNIKVYYGRSGFGPLTASLLHYCWTACDNLFINIVKKKKKHSLFFPLLLSLYVRTYVHTIINTYSLDVSVFWFKNSACVRMRSLT